MDDVFGGLAGAPGGDGGGAPVEPDRLEPVLESARLWGVELDTRYRVLACTFEPTAERYPWPSGGNGEAEGDRRIQVLGFPVSTILASLRRETEEERELLEFGEEQLVDVVAAFDGAPVSGPLFGLPEPRPGSWGPRFSLQGRSSAPDGTRRTLTIAVRHEELALDVFARFDELTLKDAAGEDLPLPTD